MKTIPLLLGLFVALAPLGAARAASEDAAPETTPIQFKDPSKPGTLRVSMIAGSLSVHGTDNQGVLVRSTLRQNAEHRADGLRVISSASGFNVYQKDNNVITLDFNGGFVGHSHNVDILVPRHTALVLTTFAGKIQCDHIDGDVDVRGATGPIELADLGGGASVETQNGKVHASFTALSKEHPVCITALSGEVVVRVPADAKANLQLRTQNGAILTDFDEKELVTTSTDVPRVHVLRAHAGAKAARQAHNQASDALPPLPSLPPLPPMTGGKEVSGVLNGGGADVTIATLNGDVTVRKNVEK